MIICIYHTHPVTNGPNKRWLQKAARERPPSSTISNDRHKHSITHFGAVSFKGFGPEATTNAPVSIQADNNNYYY